MVAVFNGPKGLGVNLERCTATQEHELGMVVQGKTPDGEVAEFRYVKFKDAVTYVYGHMTWLDADPWEVTNDVSGALNGTGAQYLPVGTVFQTTVPATAYYGWVQRSGIADVLIGSASVVAGTPLKADGTTDGALDLTTDGAAGVTVTARAIETIADTAVGRVALIGCI